MESTNNYMNPKDMQFVIDTIPMLQIRKWLDEDIQMLFKILYWCALRPNEALRLKKEDFRMANRTVHLGSTKTRDNDTALIPSVFVNELQAYLNSKNDGELFPNLKYITFYFWLKRLGKLCNIEAWQTHQDETKEKTVGHIFRKSVGKDMINGTRKDKNGQKFDIPIISKHLRHAKPSMTMDHYLKSSLESVKEKW